VPHERDRVTQGGIAVLLVEDNEVYRSSLELLLGMHDGIRVVGAVSEGSRAAASVEALDPDVVLMDFRLPGLDGAEATAALRARRPDVAVVCLTAEASEDERAAVIAAGAAALVEKGEPIQRLVDVIRAAAGAVA
jgi:DNA-binding NarL/FixJ family response regulator